MPRDKEHMTESQLANIVNHKWKPGQSGNPKGKAKNRARQYFKKIVSKAKLKRTEGLTLDEINTIEKKVLEVSLSDLQVMAKNDESPSYLKSLCMAIIIDMKNGRTDTVNKLRERQYGSVKQQVEVTGKDGAPLMEQRMSQEQAKELLQKLEEDF